MPASKSVVVVLLFLLILASCAPGTATVTGTPPPTEGATPTATGAPAATKAPFSPTRPPPTMAPIVGRLHCPECAEEGRAIDLFEHERGDEGVVVGQAQHGDAVHILVRGRRGYRLARVQVMGTGLTGWVYPEYVVAP